MFSQYQKFVFGGAKLFALVAAVGFFSTIAGASQNPEQQARSLNAQPIKMAWAATSPRLADSESCAPHCAADFPDYWHLYLAANNSGGAAVEVPSLLRAPARELQQEGHIVLATLRAVNIQVRGQWHAEPSNAFSIYAQDNGRTGILMLTTSLPETKVVTVEVKDMFSYLNPLYEDLAATAIITVQPGMALSRLLSFTPATVYIGEKNVKGVVTLVNYKNAVQGCDPQQIYSPALFGEPNILGFPDWLSNYHSKEKFAIESAEYSFDIEPPATPNIYVFSVTANVYCDFPNFPNSADLISFTDNYTLAVEELSLQFTNAPTDFVAAPAGKVAEVYDLDGRGSYNFTFALIGGGQYVNADGNKLFSLGEKDGRLTVHNGVEQKELYRAPYLLTVKISDDRLVQNGGPQAITAALSVVLMTAVTNGKDFPGVSGLRGDFVYAAGGQARTLQADEDFDLLPKINSGATLIVEGGSKIAVQSDSFVFVLEPGFEDRLILINGSSLLGLVTTVSDHVEGLTAYYGKENLLEGEQGVIYEIGAGTQFEKLNDKPLLQCIDLRRLSIQELQYACGVSGEQAQIVGDSASRRLRTLANAAVVPLAEEPSNSLRLDFVSKSLTNKEHGLHFLVTRGSLELPQLLTNYLNMPAYDTGRWLLYDIEDNSNILTVAPGPQLPPFAKLTIHAHQDVVMTVTAENVQTQIGWEVLANTDFVVGEFDGVVRGATQSSLPSGLITLTVQVADQFSVLRPQRYTNYLATGQVTIFVWEPLEQSAPPILTVPHLFGGVLATLTAAGGDGQYTYDTSAADFSLLPAGAEVVLSVLTPQEGPAQHIITVVLRDGAGSRAAESTVTVIFRAPVSLSAMEVITVHSEYVGVVTTLEASLEGGDYAYSPIGISPQFGVGIDDGVVSITMGVAGETLLLLTAQVQANTNPPSYGTVTVMVKVLPPLELAAPNPVTVAHLYTGMVATLSAAGGNGVAASYSYAIDSTLFDVSNNEGEGILLLTAAQNGAMRLTSSVVLSDTINSPPATAVVTVEVLPPVSLLQPKSSFVHHAFTGAIATLSATGANGDYQYDVVGETPYFSVGSNDGVVSISTAVNAAAVLSVTARVMANTQPPSSDTAILVVTVLPPLSLLSPPQRSLSHQQTGSVAVFTASGGDGKYSYTWTESDKFSLLPVLPGATSAVLSLMVPQEGPAILVMTATLRDAIGSLPVQAAATVEILSPLSLLLAAADGHVHSEYIGTVALAQGQGGYSDYGYSLVGSAGVFAIDEASGMISIIQAVEGLATLSVTVRVSDKPPLPALPTEAIATMVITVVEVISFGEVPAKLTVIANYWQFLATLEASGGYGDISLSVSGDDSFDSFYLTNGTLSYGTLYATPSGDGEQARMITLVVVADDTGAALPETVSIAVAVSAKLAASFATRVRTSRQVIDGLGKTQTSGGIAPYTYRLVDGGFSIIGGDGGEEGGGGLPVFGSNHLTVVMTTGQLSVIAEFPGATELIVKWAVNDSDNERTPELTVTTVVEVVDGVVLRSTAGRGYQVELTAQVSGHPERTGALGLFTLFATGVDGKVSYAAPIFTPSTVAAAFTVLYDGAEVAVSLTAYLLDEPQKLSINVLVSAEVESQTVTDGQLLQVVVVQPPPVLLSPPLMMTLYDGGDNCCLVAATMTGESGLTPYGYTLFDDSGNLTIVAEENSVVLSLRVKPTAAATLTVSLAVFDAYQPPRSATVKAMVTVLAPLTLSLPAQVRPLRHEIMELIATLAGMGGDAQYTYTVLHLPHDRYKLTDDYRLSVRLAGVNSYSVTVVLMDKIGSTAATAVASVFVFSTLAYTAPDKVSVYSRYTGVVATVMASGGDGEYIYTASGDDFTIVNNNGEGVLSLTVAYAGLTILTVSVGIADMIGSQATTATVSLIIQPPLVLSAPSNIVTVAHMYVGVLATLTAAGGSGAEDSYLYTVAGSKANLVSNDETATLSLTLAHRGATSFTLTAVLSDTAGNRPIEELITVSVLPPLGLLVPATLTISYLQTGVLMTLLPSGGRQPYTHQISEQAFTVHTTEAYVPFIDSAGATLASMVQVYALSITEPQAGLRRPTLTIVLTDAIGSPPLTATMFIETRSSISVSVSVKAVVPSNYPLYVGQIFAVGGDGDYIYSVVSPLSLFAIDADGVILLTAEIIGATILYATIHVRDSSSPSAVTLMLTVNTSPPLALTAPDELTLAYRSLPVLATLTMTGGHGEYSFTLSDLSLFSLSIDAAATVAVLSLSVAQESPWHTTLTIVLHDALGSLPAVAAVTMTVLPQLVLPEIFLTIRNSAYSTAQDNRTSVLLQAVGGSGNYVYSLESALTLSVDAATGELFLSKDISGPVTLKIDALVWDPISLPQTQATANIWLVVNPPLEADGSAYPLFSGVVDTAGKIKTSGAWGRGRDTFSLVRNPNNAFAVQPDGLLVLTLAQPITVLTPVVLVSNGAETVKVSVEISVQPEKGGGDLYEDGEMLIIGGYRYGTAKQKILSAEVWASDDGITWDLRTAAAEFGPRILPEAIQYKGRIWLVGGESADGLAQDIWSSSDGGVTWRRDVETVPFGDTFGGALVAYNGKMWFLSTGGEVWNTDNGIDWNSVAQGKGYPQRPQGKYFAEAFGIRLLLFAGDGENSDIWASSDGTDWTRTRNDQNWLPRDGVAIEASRRTENGLAFNEQIFVMRGGSLNQHDEILVAKGGGDEWDFASYMPSTVGIDAGRQYAGFVFYRGSLYVAGGRRINGELLGDVWRGNRSGLNWKLATGNLGGRSHHAMIVAKRLKLPEFGGLQLGDMYVIGGIYTPGQVWRYRHGDWTQLPNIVGGGQYVEMVYYEDALYAHSKYGGAVGNLYVTRNPEKGWNPVANELSNTQLHMVSYDGKIITIQDDKVRFFEDGKWTHKTYEGRAGGDIDLVAHKGLLYALGGYADSQNGPYFDDVWRSADGENWTKVNDPSGFPPQAGNFVSDNEYIYLIGGHGIALTTGGLGEGDTTYNLGDDDLGEITQLVLRSTDAIHWVTLYAPKGNIISKYDKTAPWDIGSDQYESDLAVGSDGQIYVVGGVGVKDGFWESTDQAEEWMPIAAAWDNDENQGPGVAVVTNLDATIPAVFILDDVPIIEIPSGFHGDFPLVTMKAVGGNQFFSWSITDDPYNMFDIGKESGIIYAVLGLEGPIPLDGGTFDITVRADSDIYSDKRRVRMRILPPVSLQARFDTTKGEFTQQEEGIVGNIHWVAGAWGGDEKYNFYSLASNPQSAFAMDGNALVLTVTGMIGGYTPVVRLSNGGQFVDIPVAVTVLQPAGGIHQGDLFVVGGYVGDEITGGYSDEVWRYRGTEWTLLTDNISGIYQAEAGTEVAYYQGRLYLLGVGEPSNGVLSSDDGISWREEEDMPDVRSYHTAVPHKGKLVVFGGYMYDDDYTIIQPEVWEFDGKNWKYLVHERFTGSIRFNGHYDFDGVSHRGLLYASGGQSIYSFLDDRLPPEYYNDVWVSENGGITWKRVDEDADSKYEGGKGVMLKGIDPDSGAINLYQVRSRGGMRATVWSSLAGVEWTQRGVVEEMDFDGEMSDGAFDGRQLFVFTDITTRVLRQYESTDGKDWDRTLTEVPKRTEYQMVAAPYLDAPTPLTFDVPKKWVVVPQNYVGKILTIRAWGGAGVYSYSLLSQQREIFSLDKISGKIALLQPRTSDLIYATVRVESGGQVIEQIVQIGSRKLPLNVQNAGIILVPSNHGGKPFYTAEVKGGYLPYTYRVNPVSGQQNQVHITPQGELFIPLVKLSQVQSQEVIVEVIDAAGNSAGRNIQISVTPPFNWVGVTAINEVIPYNEKRKLWDSAGKNFPSGGVPFAGAQPYLFSIGVFTSTPGDHNLSVDVATGDVWKLADGWSGNLYRQEVQITLIWSDAQGERLLFTRNIEVGGRLRLEWNSDQQSIPNRYAGVIGTLSLQPTDYPAGPVNYYTNHYNFDVSADGAMIANPAPFGPATVIIQVWAENDVLSSAPRMLTIKIDAPIKVGASERAAADHEFLPMASVAENLMMPPRNEEPQPPNILWLSLGSRCFDDAAVIWRHAKEFEQSMPRDLGRSRCTFANASGDTVLLGAADGHLPTSSKSIS